MNRISVALRAGLIGAGFVLTSQLAVAEPLAITVAEPNFSSAAGRYQLNGAATIDGASLKLNQAAGNLYGTAFFKELVSLPSNRSFSAYFTFKITNPECGTGGGADGLAFIVQTDSSAVGSMGGGIGYAGILPSVAVEFDTFKNDGFKDPDDNHIGVSLNGDPESVATAPAPVLLVDGNTYHAWIDYDGADDLLQVRLAETAERPDEASLSYTVDLEEVLRSDVYVGFTAATGSCMEQHNIGSFYFSNEALPGGIDTSSGGFVAR
jgi:Legume lectin domain